MHDDESGSGQPDGWQPPEYVSPWIPASGGGDQDSGSAPADSPSSSGTPGSGEAGQRAGEEGETLSFGREPGYGPGGYAAPGYGQAPEYGRAQEFGPQAPQYGEQQAPGYGPGGSYEQGPAYGAPAGGYGQAPGYGQPGYGQANFGPQGPGYGPQGPGYGPPPGGYGNYQWGGYGAPPPPPARSGFGKAIAYVAVAVLAAAAGAGAAVALDSSGNSSPSASPGIQGGNGSSLSPGQNGAGNTPVPLPSSTGGTGASGGTSSGTGSLDAAKIAAEVDPGIVDITSQLTALDATAEGTGMVLTAGGLVLTNNHVIDESTSVTATLVSGTQRRYPVKVIGYDSTDDVALLQLEGASGLKTVTLSDSARAKVGDAVLALGNAGGKGGTPSTAQGTIQALDQSIKASDSSAGTTEDLKGMIETDAPIQEGDSGGPLVNGNGAVVGMDTAANTSSGGGEGGGDGSSTGIQGFAIPINTAKQIANEINAGQASAKIHLGLAGYIGVEVVNASDPNGCRETGGGAGGFNSITSPVSSGALICQAGDDTPAAIAGLVKGDAITSINGTTIGTATALTNFMAPQRPGARLSVSYVNQDGAKRTATVTLTSWAK
jgi:S1-C subfamily serine protease